MPSQRDDYLIRLVEELRIFVAQAMQLRDAGKLSQALLKVVSAEERLFARPAAEFMPLALDEQLRLLRLDEPEDNARGKCLLYAALLREAGLVYQARSQEALSAAAFQLALHVTLTAALGSPARAGELRPSIADLLGRLPNGPQHAPVQEMLAAFEKLP